MNIRSILYGLICVVALAYLTTANAIGYVPFAVSAPKPGDRGSAHYHK